MPKCRILFGGSFDPPQRAHEELIARALAARPQAECWVVPAGSPPHKDAQTMSSAELRFELCELAFGSLARVRVSDEEIRRGGTSYTVETLRRHRGELGQEAELCWLLGSDSLLDLESWRKVHEILSLCQILTVPRPGFSVADLEQLSGFDAKEKKQLRAGILGKSLAAPISSTEVRTRLAQGQEVSTLISPAVLARIRQLGLYRS